MYSETNGYQAIVEGEPPDLPEEGFSEAARNFVRGCLHKIPKLRPTYAMLLQHAWLAPLVKPQTIAEEEEDDDASAEATPNDDSDSPESVNSKISLGAKLPPVIDQEVADWVLEALENRRRGKLGKGAQKPALHAAPLDAVNNSPGHSGINGLHGSLAPAPGAV
jgi:mitogen-activated protein kinase kinase